MMLTVRLLLSEPVGLRGRAAVPRGGGGLQPLPGSAQPGLPLAGLDEGLLSLFLPVLVCMENPYRDNKLQ